MLYCDDCGEEKGWPNGKWRFKSYGQCEVCGKRKPCNDAPSWMLKDLPIPKEDVRMSQEVAVAEVVKILKDVEGQLSDGYIFYCDEEVDDRLKEIAERIINSVHLLLF